VVDRGRLFGLFFFGVFFLGAPDFGVGEAAGTGDSPVSAPLEGACGDPVPAGVVVSGVEVVLLGAAPTSITAAGVDTPSAPVTLSVTVTRAS
jgi:hypothetical protein